MMTARIANAEQCKRVKLALQLYCLAMELLSPNYHFVK